MPSFDRNISPEHDLQLEPKSQGENTGENKDSRQPKPFTNHCQRKQNPQKEAQKYPQKQGASTSKNLYILRQN